MKVYRCKKAIVVEYAGCFYAFDDENWDEFINRDDAFSHIKEALEGKQPEPAAEQWVQCDSGELLAPMQSQECWASGVTYFRSKQGRQEESKDAGGADFYQRVYEAERPELFFKSTAARTVGSGGQVRIRKDSTWDVPEPELVLMITANGKIIGYSIGNDMSSRSIEGENPLYLPQAKTYDNCAAIGPCIFLTESPLPADTLIDLDILRAGQSVFSGEIEINQITRSFESLAEFLFRECSFPHGALLMTGTGIVPGNDFSLRSGDEIKIGISGIGQLVNSVA